MLYAAGDRDAPIVLTNPGSRPSIPTMLKRSAPPPARLAPTPDNPTTTGGDPLAGLDDVAWADLEHAHGPADDVPDLIRALANDSGDWDDVLDELLGDDLLHQRSCYSATAPAIPFLTRLAVSPALPVRHRAMLHCWLLIAATRETASLIDDADRAAALGDTPKPAAHTTAVHAAVGAQLPVLLREWTRQPPAVQFVLSALAAVYRTHARVIAEPLNALLTTYSETQPGAYLRLAATLITEDDTEALTLAEEIVAWDEHVSSFGLDAPGISPHMRTVMVLVDGSLNIAGNIA